MAQPTWRPVLENLTVPEKKGVAWSCALDFLPPGKLIKILVDPSATWKPNQFSVAVGADGDPGASRNPGKLILESAPLGALIGRLGISSAGPRTDELIFPVGRHCVLTVPPEKGGALYFGVNDAETLLGLVEGSLKVSIFESL